MADPQAAAITQLRNIQARCRMTIAELHAAVAASGLVRHGEKRSWLMQQFSLGYGDANAVVLAIAHPLPALGEVAPLPPAGEVLDQLYAGPKAALRPLHEAVMALVAGFGTFEPAPKKGYVSLRRRKQFAMLGPATRDTVEIGLNAPDLPVHVRLKPLPPGGMCQATTRVARLAEVDAELAGWLRQAYDAAA